MKPPPQHLILALRQRKWWLAREGPVRVKEMDTTHLVHVVAWLERKAFRLRLEYELFFFHDAADDVQWALDEDDRTDRQWLEDQPLMRALRKQLRKRGICGPDCTCPCHATRPPLTVTRIEGDPYG